jgi:hypothetical protein
VDQFTCKRCGTPKDVSDFYAKPSHPRGHEATCKKCVAGKAAIWKANNRDRARASGRRGYAKHIDEYAAYRQKRRDENPAALAEYRRQWYLKNKEHVLAKCKEYREAHAPEKRERDRKWRERNYDRKAGTDRRWRLANRERVLSNFLSWYRSLGELRFAYSRAHVAVARAIEAGTLQRPEHCQKCHRARKVQAAHFSYQRGRELEIQWLCQSCHSKWDDAQPKTKLQNEASL